MDDIYFDNGVLINTLIRLLERKKAPAIIIDTNRQSILFAHKWLYGMENPTNTYGTLIITNEENKNYHTRTINRLEYISECTFSFIPRDADFSLSGINFTGEFVRLYGVDVGGIKKTIDIAGNHEENERNSIIYVVISALVSALMTTDDIKMKHDMQNYLNAIPFSVYWKDLEGNIIGTNYRFDDLASDFDERSDVSFLEKLRLYMDKARWEDDYVIKHKKVLNNIEILNTGEWLSLSKTYAIHPKSDDMLAVVCIIEDISGHRLKDHDELWLSYVNSVFLKKMVSRGEHVAFILEGNDSLPVMYISDNMESLGLDRDRTVSGDFIFTDCIHPDDRQRVVQAFSGQNGMEAENTISFSIYTKNGGLNNIKAQYRKNIYLYNNSIIIYGTLSMEKVI